MISPLRRYIVFTTVLCSIISGLLSWLLVDHYFPWLSFYHDFFAYLSLWLLLACLFICQSRLIIVIPLYFFLFLLVAIIPLIQYCIGVVYFFGDAFIVSSYIAGFSCAFLLGLNLNRIQQARFLYYLALVLLAAACVSAVLAIMQVIQVANSSGLIFALRSDSSRAYANLGQPNNLASLLLLGCVCLCYLNETRYCGNILFWLIWLLLCFAIAATGSRTPLIAVVFLLFWWYLGQRRNLLPVMSLKKIVTMVAIFFSFQMFVPWLLEYLLLVEAPGALRTSSARLHIWMQILHAIADFKWFGYGWGQVSLAQGASVFSHPFPEATTYIEHSHNVLLDILVWNGPVIGGAIIVLLGYFLFSLYSMCSTKNGWFALLAVGFLVVHSMFEFPLEYAYFLLPFGVFLGVAASDNNRFQHIEFSMPMLSRLLCLGLFAWGMIFVWHEYRYIETRSTYIRLQAKAIYVPDEFQVERRSAVFTQLMAYIDFIQMDAKQNMNAKELEFMRKVAHRFAVPPTLSRYALALALNYQPKESKKELERLKLLHGQKTYDKALNNMTILSKKYPQLDAVLN